MTSNPSEVKVEWKKSIIGFNGLPIKDTTNAQKIARENPTILEDELLKKLSDSTFGTVFQNLLVNTQITNVQDQLKVYRWIEKLELKMTTNKGEMLLDINQLTELEDYIKNSKNTQILLIGPVMKYIEELKDKLNKQS